jgi:hypothetical protein
MQNPDGPDDVSVTAAAVFEFSVCSTKANVVSRKSRPSGQEPDPRSQDDPTTPGSVENLLKQGFSSLSSEV